MNTITVKQMMALNPCEDYTEERLTELWDGRESVTALDILEMDIPHTDKLWAVLKNWCFDDRTLRHLAADFAEMVLPNFEKVFPDDNRPRLAIQATRDLADGKITADIADRAAIAADSARWAANSAANSAAHSAAHIAYYSAAHSAANSAANSAAHSAYYSAAHSAADSAAHSAKQIAHIRKILTDRGGVYPQVPVKQVCVKGEGE